MGETNSKLDKGRLEKLMAVVRERQQQITELFDEIDRLLSGREGIGARLKALEHCFEVNWQARYHVSYVWNYTKDRAQLKRLLKTINDDEIMRRMGNYLKNEDHFYIRASHPFGVFVVSVNSFADQPEKGIMRSQLFVECRHRPSCKNDAEHTRQMLQDDRNSLGV